MEKANYSYDCLYNIFGKTYEELGLVQFLRRKYFFEKIYACYSEESFFYNNYLC